VVNPKFLASWIVRGRKVSMKEAHLTYEDVLKATIGDKRYLLTGNGFSMSYNRERFSFTSLLDSAVENGLISVHSPIYDIFQEFATKDFEEVVKLLETSVRVLEKYSADNFAKLNLHSIIPA
jgi:hypothetical protein